MHYSIKIINPGCTSGSQHLSRMQQYGYEAGGGYYSRVRETSIAPLMAAWNVATVLCVTFTQFFCIHTYISIKLDVGVK